MPSFGEIKNKTKQIVFDYHGTPVTMNVRVNFLTSELEEKIRLVTADTENVNQSEISSEISEILEYLVASWDVEDALPTKDIFVEFGVVFMIGAFTEISNSILPKNATGNA